jgi:hypothetical protein
MNQLADTVNITLDPMAGNVVLDNNRRASPHNDA